jgi:hypothetical protein
MADTPLNSELIGLLKSPIILAKNRGISAHRLNEIASLVFQNQQFLTEKYHEYHNR